MLVENVFVFGTRSNSHIISVVINLCSAQTFLSCYLADESSANGGEANYTC